MGGEIGTELFWDVEFCRGFGVHQLILLGCGYAQHVQQRRFFVPHQKFLAGNSMRGINKGVTSVSLYMVSGITQNYILLKGSSTKAEGNRLGIFLYIRTQGVL